MFYIASDKSFQWYQSKPQLIMDFELLFHISMCAEIYSLYVMIDIFDILIVFINSEKWRTIKDCVVIDIYIYIYDVLIVRFRYVSRTLELCAIVLLLLHRLSIMFFNTSTLELCAIVLLLLYRLSNMVLCICDYLSNPYWYIYIGSLTHFFILIKSWVLPN